MIKYTLVICLLHFTYVLYLFWSLSYIQDKREQETIDALLNYIKENCFIFLIMLPIYLNSMGV